MPKSTTNTKVDFFFIKAKKWKDEFVALRTLALNSGLTEDLKWGKPCYTLNNSNVILIHGFKDYCALLFIKGALIKDTKGILIQQTENVQVGRQLRFTGLQEITKLQSTIKAYMKEAIEIEKKGLKVELKKTTDYKMPDELKARLSEDAAFKKAFYALTPGRQRGYLLYFASAKQEATRLSRIEKCTPNILTGKGVDE